MLGTVTPAAGSVVIAIHNKHASAVAFNGNLKIWLEVTKALWSHDHHALLQLHAVYRHDGLHVRRSRRQQHDGGERRAALMEHSGHGRLGHHPSRSFLQVEHDRDGGELPRASVRGHARPPTNGDNAAYGISTVTDHLDTVAVDLSSGAFAGTAGLA